jgi:protocatechuate 3,4-dioxygenase beta subunit
MTTRRSLFKQSFAAAAAAATGVLAAREAAAACVEATPAQTEGPFYPVTPQSDTNWDLTQIQGRAAAAVGERLYIVGQVTDQDCQPVAGALVEIWQACASGRYSHPGDTSGLELDRNFQYWGRVLTDSNGEYKFKTIIPGDYPASSTWQRPPHIHYKVQKRAHAELTTQLYFSGHPLNDGDLILLDLPTAERERVVVDVKDADPDLGFDAKYCRFDIGLRRL